MLILATDVDNTIAHTNEILDPLMQNITGKEVRLSHYGMNVSKYGSDINKEIDEALVKIRKGGWYSKLTPMEYSAPFLSSFVAQGNKVIYITSRAPYYDTVEDGAKELKQWLATNRFPQGIVSLVNGINEKVDVANSRNAHVIVDDLVEVSEATLASKSGMKPFVFEAEWNSYYNNKYVTRVQNWKKMARAILEEFAQVV